jgi:peptidoglycan/LPS O-acetylase OafA/YrhL
MIFIIDNAILGSYGVWFFWMISGFIFSHMLINQKISLYEFSIKRFSRLYPLHFATLIIITILEFYSLFKFGNYQLDSNLYDLYHFILNLFFISEWGLQNGYSFNRAVWSVSIEIPVYFGFFILLYFITKNHFLYILIIMLLSKVVLHSEFVNYHLKACFFYFMFGSFIYFICKKFDEYRMTLLLISIIGIILVPTSFILEKNMIKTFESYIPTTLLLFSSIICLAFCLESKFATSIKKINFLGNSSYAMYLLHMPIIVLIMILIELGFIREFIFTRLEFIVFFIFLVNISSIICFKYFENPIRKKLNFMMIK